MYRMEEAKQTKQIIETQASDIVRTTSEQAMSDCKTKTLEEIVYVWVRKVMHQVLVEARTSRP